MGTKKALFGLLGQICYRLLSEFCSSNLGKLTDFYRFLPDNENKKLLFRWSTIFHLRYRVIGGPLLEGF